MEDVGGTLWMQWHAHPDALIGLVLFEGAYLLGVGPIRVRYRLADEIDPLKTATFTLGVIVMFAALVSPLHVLSDKYLFSAHMFQHILLTLVAPPLLILGTPDWLIRRLLRPDWAFRAVRVVTHPVAAFAVFNLIFALWHMPGLYNLSVTNHGIHVGEHLLFIGAAVIMWWPLTSTMPELPRLSYPAQMVYLFVLSTAQIIVFAPITFAKEPLYEWYVDAPQIWSLSPVMDQQIGAILMKIGGGAIFMALLILAFFNWFNGEEAKAKAPATEAEPIRD